MLEKFKAFRVHAGANPVQCRFETLTMDDLDMGTVVIKTAYSAINYKDAMAARGVGKNVRTDRPCVTGIDLSGVVISSADPRYNPGDPVIVTNFKLGVNHDGGYAEYARVPAEWIVPLPPGLNLFEAMALGTAGLTAALAVDRLERAGLTSRDGPVVVTGATGGVGSLTVDILSKLGYEVTAITGKTDKGLYLKSVGAEEIMLRGEIEAGRDALAPARWAAAVDSVGGVVLDRVIAATKDNGKIAVCGMAAGPQLITTVFPLILRAVDILGINVSRALSMNERLRLWGRVATDLKPRHLPTITQSVPFNALNSTFDRFFESTVTGRLVVEIGP